MVLQKNSNRFGMIREILQYLKSESMLGENQNELTDLVSDWIKLTTYELQVVGYSCGADWNADSAPETLNKALWQLGQDILRKYSKLKSAGGTAQEMLCDAIMLQRVLIHFLPPDLLKLKAESIKRKFVTLVGQESYDQFFPHENTTQTVELNDLRADLDFILSETMSVYLMTPLRPMARGRLLAYCLRPFLLITSLMLILSCILAIIEQRFDQMAALAWVPVFGAMGAMISLQQRVENLPSRGDIIRNVIALESSKSTLWTTSIAGAIFGVILNLIFAAKIIEGNLFPSFQFIVDESSSGSGLNALSDASKMLIWSFIAGFAERLVPDTITRLTQVLQSRDSGKSHRSNYCKNDDRENGSEKADASAHSTLVALGRNRDGNPGTDSNSDRDSTSNSTPSSNLNKDR